MKCLDEDCTSAESEAHGQTCQMKPYISLIAASTFFYILLQETELTSITVSMDTRNMEEICSTKAGSVIIEEQTVNSSSGVSV